MFDVRYEAYPKVFRMRPLSTLLVFVIMVAAFLVIGVGRYAPPTTLAGLIPGLSAQNVQTLGVVLFALSCVRLYVWYAPTRFERLTVTADKLLYRRGFATKQRIEIPLGLVKSVQVAQSAWQRTLDIGDVSIYVDGDRPELVVRGLPDPLRIRELVTGQAPTAAAA